MTFKRLIKHLKNGLIASSLGFACAIASISVSKAEMIALSLPISGDFSEIGRDFSQGAKLAIELLGKTHQLFIADDGCDEDLSTLAAEDIKSIKPAIVTGMLCNTSAIALANEMSEENTPLLIAGARSVRLIKDREREAWNLWRLSPGDDAPAEAIANYISTKLKDTAFALVDDGTIYGRSLTDAIRLKLDDAGMKPQFADTFRAAQSTQSGMLRRLERSGVEIAFVAASTTEDLFTITKDHKSLKIKNTLVVTEQLASLPYFEGAGLVSDGIMVVMQQPFEANESLAELLKERKIKPSKALYEGYAAIEVAVAALGETYQATSNNLASKRFETINGTAQFDNRGKNIHNPYKFYIWQNGVLEPLDNANNL